MSSGCVAAKLLMGPDWGARKMAMPGWGLKRLQCPDRGSGKLVMGPNYQFFRPRIMTLPAFWPPNQDTLLVLQICVRCKVRLGRGEFNPR